MKKFLMAIMSAVMRFCFNFSEVKAADLFDVIYQEIRYFKGNEQESQWIASAIMYASGEYQVDPILITAVMEAESGFNFKSISSAGAIGLMQLMPETAQMIGVNLHNPFEKILGGTMYLKNQLNRFSGYGQYAVTDAVAAYNAGLGAVIKAGGVSNYSETRQYIVNVYHDYNKLFQMMMNQRCDESETKGLVKKKFSLKSGKNNKNLGNKVGSLNYAKGKEREQYEKEIRSVKTLFDGIF